MKKLILLLFILSMVPLWAAPEDWQVTPPDSLQTQMEINGWIQNEYSESDAELNRVWKQLLPKLDEREKESLVTAQLLWIKFRDAQAKSASLGYEGGSIAPYIHSESMLLTTRMRTYQLRLRLDELIRLGN
jgi:uncharacterized protein YecT (DUF1311 family)